MDKLLDQLTEKLKKKFGDRLVSVVLYGSAAAGDRQEGFSDYNVLCVLHEITRRELAEAEEIARWWRERGNPSPLLLSEREVRTCTDAFAIEFHDLRDSHRILWGKDVIERLEIDDSFYRAQVEQELRGKLLRLRQKAAGMLSDRSLLRRLLADSVSTFCVLFRHALILSGAEAPLKKRDIIAQAGRVFGLDPEPFTRLLDLREERVKPREVDPVQLLDAYLSQIGIVIEAVDRVAK